MRLSQPLNDLLERLDLEPLEVPLEGDSKSRPQVARSEPKASEAQRV